MRRGLTGLVGFGGGVVFIALLAFAAVRPLLSKTTTSALPAERWSPGATAWEAATDQTWQERWQDAPLGVSDGLLNPRVPEHLAQQWWSLSRDEALARYYDDPPCAWQREPGSRPLTGLPADCVRLTSLAVFADGGVIAIIVREPPAPDEAVVLPAGSTVWTSIAPPPQSAGGDLVTGAGGQAVYGGIGERVAVFADGRWQSLPPNLTPRIGFSPRLLDDGTVVIRGGERDDFPRSVVFMVLPLLVLASLGGLAWFARRRWQVALRAPAIGFALSFVLAFVGAIVWLAAMLPALAWH